MPQAQIGLLFSATDILASVRAGSHALPTILNLGPGGVNELQQPLQSLRVYVRPKFSWRLSLPLKPVKDYGGVRDCPPSSFPQQRKPGLHHSGGEYTAVNSYCHWFSPLRQESPAYVAADEQALNTFASAQFAEEEQGG
ncbi:hypothetical protein EDB81DRAFT_763540 [Dactylonectria macrodidyma]|uniref:Uncharacterized protein n=1 Tax=Dactylonectria macrodidyma TaxID=307937 RepID=A0A9P9E229_9HYPO|nr:hypothetical protein EDB81DRAFT_763540 [Dactylonectria macrodidyma]